MQKRGTWPRFPGYRLRLESHTMEALASAGPAGNVYFFLRLMLAEVLLKNARREPHRKSIPGRAWNERLD